MSASSSLPSTMIAIVAERPGDPDVLKAIELPLPQPGAHDLLIRVAAAGVNRPDVMQRRGDYPPPPGAPETLGLEIAGEIVACGPAVARRRLGERVAALVPGGGYAEYCRVHERHAFAPPRGCDMIRAAAIPETWLTVWANLFTPKFWRPGARILIHGGASGIGTTAIQLCRAFGARAIATVGSAEKAQTCLKLGAERAFLHSRRDESQRDWDDLLREETAGKGVDVILDMVGGDYFDRNVKSLAFGGRLIQIAFMHGAQVEFDAMPLLLKRVTLTGSTLRSRSIAEKATLIDRFRVHVAPLLDSGAVAPIVDRTFPLVEAAAAHRYMESGAHIGKIVLVCAPSS